MTTAYGYGLSNVKRDLSDVLSTVVAKAPRFISRFTRVDDALDTKHEWNEDSLSPRVITMNATGVYSDPTFTLKMSAADYAAIKVGTVLRPQGSAAILQVTAKTSVTNVAAVAIALNGATAAAGLIADATVLDIVSTPQSEGSGNGDGEDVLRVNGTNFNYTQIIRKEMILTGTALAKKIYGNVDNSVDAQTAFKMQEFMRDMNRMSIWGVAAAASESVKGQAGGLYNFGTATGGLSVTATSTPDLTSTLVNDGAEKIIAAGGDPNLILCSILQARGLSAEYASKLQVVVDDQESGQFIAKVKNDVTGQLMTIMADYDCVVDQAWVLDDRCFGLSFFRALTDEDATTAGFDGIKRILLGEVTLEFKNALARTCLIKGLSTT